MAELTEKADKVGKEVVDVAGDVGDLAVEASKEVVREVYKNPALFAGMGYIVGAVTGGFVAYKIASKKLETKYDKLMQEESLALKQHYEAKVVAKAQTEKPALESIIEEQGYAAPIVGKEKLVPEEPKVEVHNHIETVNVFEGAETDEWDYAKEVKSRDPRFPYVVHVDEHKENSKEYEQVTLTFFEGDGVLCDEQDQVISEQEEAVGLENLDKFGHGSGDPNIVYVRNEVREIDYEIVKSAGLFAQEVHGFDPDQLSHSQKWSRKGRYDDD